MSEINIPLFDEMIAYLQDAEAAQKDIDIINHQDEPDPRSLEKPKDAKEEAYYHLAELVHGWVADHYPNLI